MKIQDFVIADISEWLNNYSNYIVNFAFVSSKAIFKVVGLPKSAYNEMRDIALENDFKIDIGHNSIILY